MEKRELVVVFCSQVLAKCEETNGVLSIKCRSLLQLTLSLNGASVLDKEKFGS